jgi:glyceraldehyde-3-phosphate dehydrogenase/erythrose-4-phosphate dehydrogenase
MMNVPQASHDYRDVNVGLAGAGRIGGGLINAVADMGHPFDISTVVDVVSPETLQYRLKRDSAGSGFDGEIRVEGEKMAGESFD